ncbi:hypothetical protein [Clostridium magnum]|uniref:DUF2140 domain-containing protein n=1 Tax=Clostridium magnum DSM 2767 TaxID=1121326 RepID=A0A161YHH1_9CLOT|nr:hypothetical protein [Clostridium magnum]KZL89712.1 hypothetical protein CLMAG_47100 [Clostridium magnum DSM 2767]SHH64543.1 hypothetical protein SAMN02745944_01082 [Clostridium magnum DSM 2767]
MTKLKNKKKISIFLSVALILIVLLGVFFTSLFSNSSYVQSDIKISSELIDKIREAQKQGATLQLNNEELNQVKNMYFKGQMTSGSITVKGIYPHILNNGLKLYIPISYKGYNLLVSSEGNLTLDNNNIQYKSSYFKVGTIRIPNSLVLNKLKNYLKKGVSINSENIVLDKSMISLQIKSLQIKDEKLLLGVEKSSTTIEEQLKALENKTKSSLQGGSKSLSTTDTEENSIIEKSDEPSKKESADNSSSQPAKNTEEMNQAFDRISSGLNAAMSSVSTSGQKAVISEMISVINSMKGNPSMDTYSAASGARDIYKNLSPSEKAELKSAVFSNINGNDINIVSQMLGK